MKASLEDKQNNKEVQVPFKTTRQTKAHLATKVQLLKTRFLHSPIHLLCIQVFVYWKQDGTIECLLVLILLFPSLLCSSNFSVLDLKILRIFLKISRKKLINLDT